MPNKKPERKDDAMIIIYPHDRRSKAVTADDLPRVKIDIEGMFDLSQELIDAHVMRDLYALAHPQVTTDPLRFFILNFYSNRMKESYYDLFPPVIINPEIVRHTNVAVLKKEGCATFPTEPMAPIERYTKMVVRFESPFNAKTKTEDWSNLMHYENITVNGLMAQIFQHEIDHLNGKWIHTYEKSENV